MRIQELCTGFGHLASSEVVMAEKVHRGTGALLYSHSPCCPPTFLHTLCSHCMPLAFLPDPENHPKVLSHV